MNAGGKRPGKSPSGGSDVGPAPLVWPTEGDAAKRRPRKKKRENTNH